MSDSRVSRERLGFLDILGNTIDWTIRGFSTPLVGWQRRSIRSSPFHEVGFGSMVFVRFFRFFNRGIIRTTLLATCWWLRHPIWHRSSLFWVELPMMTSFGEENVPWRAEIGKPPTCGHRDLGAVKWEWTVKCENEESFFPPDEKRSFAPPLRRSENVTKCISTSRPKGFDAFVEAVFRESERVPDFDRHDSSLERGKVHHLSGKFRQNECNRYKCQLDR